ncbi:MAG: dihydropteroate synthase, partial [Bacteroidia bacterium]|nr:dihydropteroate synthase [Bacteroidia bacterium]
TSRRQHSTKAAVYDDEKSITGQGRTNAHRGATFLDVGGYSSRPGAADIPEDLETKRSAAAIAIILKHFPGALISVDTFRSHVARACVQNGAAMVNDISGGLLDVDMLATVARLRVPYVLMHMRGTPQTMNQQTHYEHLIKDVLDYFHDRVAACRAAGLFDIIIDPGFGFAKTSDQNYELLQQLPLLRPIERPVMAGVSRKSMIWKTLGITPEEALNGTTALHMLALLGGASILRAHDVKQAAEAITLFQHYRAAR